MTNILTEADSENLKSCKTEGNNSSHNRSGAATVAKSATPSSYTRRATGPRTPQGKERSKFNARKHDLFSKDVLLHDESRTEYDALLDGLMEDRQPRGKLGIVLVEKLATNLWRQRRLLQVETAEIEKARSRISDSALQNKLDELEYAQLKDASDAKLGHSNPVLLLRNAIQILHLLHLSTIAAESGDIFRRALKSIYGYQDGGPEPYGWRQMSLMLSKLTSSAEPGEGDSKDPADVRQKVAEAIAEEMTRIADLEVPVLAAQARRRFHSLAAAHIPSQEVTDLLIRCGAHLSREFDRTLAQLDRCSGCGWANQCCPNSRSAIRSPKE